MKQIQASQFRTTFGTYDEPVEVVKYKQVLGTWYPTGAEPFEEPPVTTDTVMGYRTELEAQALEIKELKRLLAANAKPGPKITMSSMIAADDQGFGRSRPAPKPGKAK